MDKNSRFLLTRRQALLSLAAFGAGSFIKPSSLFASETPSKPLRFAVLGDWGVGDRESYELAKKMFDFHQASPVEFVLTVGDNIYPNGCSSRFIKNFEKPFTDLIRAEVPFFTTFGNHDVEDKREHQLNYSLFNMNGADYYLLNRGNGLADFFMLDSTNFNKEQEMWLIDKLGNSKAKWKMAFFHHPLYSSGKKHGSHPELRKQVEPIFQEYGVKVVFSGHDHFYERLHLQRGIQYFVTGGGGKLRTGGLNMRSNIRATSYDLDNHFMVIEMDEAQVSFKAISRTGALFDEGVIKKVIPAQATPAQASAAAAA